MKIAQIKKHIFVAAHLHFKILRVKCRMKQGSVVISLSARGNGDRLCCSLTQLKQLHKNKNIGQSQKITINVRYQNTTAVPPVFGFCPALVFPCVCHCLHLCLIEWFQFSFVSSCPPVSCLVLCIQVSIFVSSLCLVLTLVTVNTLSVFPFKRLNLCLRQFLATPVFGS